MKVDTLTMVQPALLLWARETIGMTTQDVATKLQRPVSDIEAWESGDASPTYSQLEKLAYEIYKRPLALFFLPAPPEEIQPQQEFRSLPSSDTNSLLPDTRLRIRQANAYQLTLKELFNNSNPTQRKIWQQLSLSMNSSIINQSHEIRSQLGISLDEQVKWANHETALKTWRSIIESAGIYVFKWTFKQKTISGFSLLDNEFPIIYLNNSNTKSRQIFSLIHELAHILLGSNGICLEDVPSSAANTSDAMEIETFCNRIAAEVLVPTLDFEQQFAGLNRNSDADNDKVYSKLASRYGVSLEVILRRLLDQGRISSAYYTEQVEKRNPVQSGGAGGSYYATINTYLSPRFAQEVVRRQADSTISAVQASEMLGINVKNYFNLEQHIIRGEAA